LLKQAFGVLPDQNQQFPCISLLFCCEADAPFDCDCIKAIIPMLKEIILYANMQDFTYKNRLMFSQDA
jgi:hypothetical protein